MMSHMHFYCSVLRSQSRCYNQPTAIYLNRLIISEDFEQDDIELKTFRDPSVT